MQVVTHFDNANTAFRTGSFVDAQDVVFSLFNRGDEQILIVKSIFMKNYLRTFLLIALFSGLYSCTPSAPYEIKSPCVAVDPENPYAISPCVRTPVNLKYSVV